MGWKQGDEPILSTARTSWVASRYCWRLEMRGSYTNCSFISEANRVRNQAQSGKEKRRYNTPLFPLLKQSMPNRELLSLTCRLFTSVRVSIGERPLFSASASGTASSAAENARIAYCSIVGICQVSGKLRSRDHQKGTKSAHLISCLGYCYRTADFCCTTTVNNTVVNHEVAHDAECVV